MYFETHDLEETQRSHRQILATVAARDEQAVSIAVQEHLGHAMSEIVAVIAEENE
jgi:DNA-binding GntR family transcriptional regulator